MSRFLIIVSAIALLAFGALTLFQREPASQASPHISRPPAPSAPIRTCVNLGGALEAPTEGEWGYTIRQTDLRLIKALGFDTVRIPVKWSAHTATQPPYTINENFARRVDEVVTQALDAGLQAIVDVHHYDEINEDPVGQYPRLKAIWQQISDRYKEWPQGLMFEFLNEPHTKITERVIDQMNRELLSMVRADHPDRWVILGGVQWGNLSGLVETNPPYDPRVMTTFHYYDPFEFTHQGAPWAYEKVPLGSVSWGSSLDRRTLARHFAAAAEWRDKTGMPMLLGEFGVYGEVNDAERAVWTESVRRTSEMLDIGWCYWDWATSLGMYNLDTERVRPGMSEALFGQ